MPPGRQVLQGAKGRDRRRPTNLNLFVDRETIPLSAQASGGSGKACTLTRLTEAGLQPWGLSQALRGSNGYKAASHLEGQEKSRVTFEC